MRGPPDAETAARALRRASQLRSLFRQLPHVGTPREREAVAEWHAFREGRRDTLSLASARLAVRHLWCEEAAAEVLSVVERLPREAREADRTLMTYETLARWVLSEGPARTPSP